MTSIRQLKAARGAGEVDQVSARRTDVLLAARRYVAAIKSGDDVGSTLAVFIRRVEHWNAATRERRGELFEERA